MWSRSQQFSCPLNALIKPGKQVRGRVHALVCVCVCVLSNNNKRDGCLLLHLQQHEAKQRRRKCFRDGMCMCLRARERDTKNTTGALGVV